jgi:hypothetical protein
LLCLAATTSPTAAFLAGPLSTILGSLLISFLVFGFLLLDKLFNSLAILEVMALSAMDLAILPVGAFRLVGRQGLTVGTPGNLLAGGVSLDLFGGGNIAGSLGGKHGFALALSAVTPPTSPCRGDIFTFQISSCANILAGKFPPLFSPCTLVDKSVNLTDISDLVHRQFLPHLAVTHVLVKRTDNRGRVDIWDVVLDTAESLDVFAQVLSFLLGMRCKSLSCPGG